LAYAPRGLEVVEDRAEHHLDDLARAGVLLAAPSGLAVDADPEQHLGTVRIANGYWGIRVGGSNNTLTVKGTCASVNIGGADGMLSGVDWTTAHTQEQSDTRFCQFFSKIEDSQFTMSFSEPGKPFVCAVVNGDTIDTDYQ
jgi:hypothetical protein